MVLPLTQTIVQSDDNVDMSNRVSRFLREGWQLSGRVALNCYDYDGDSVIFIFSQSVFYPSINDVHYDEYRARKQYNSYYVAFSAQDDEALRSEVEEREANGWEKLETIVWINRDGRFVGMVGDGIAFAQSLVRAANDELADDVQSDITSNILPPLGRRLRRHSLLNRINRIG